MLDENNVEMGQGSEENNHEKNLDNGITNVVYLDDNQVMLENFRTIYSPYFRVFITNSAEEAKEIIKNNEIHIIISDQRMPDITGVEFFSSIIKQYPNPIRILLTAFTEIEVIINAINYGHIYQYVRKPYVFEDMKKMLEDAAQIYHLRKGKQQFTTTSVVQSNEELKLIMYNQNPKGS